MTGPLLSCVTRFPQGEATLYRPATWESVPVGWAYTKPMIFLVDEFSVSFGDIFLAVMQDNRRGLSVGMRTGGTGRSILGFPAGYFSEATSTNRNSLAVRRNPVTAPGLPTAALIENIGVIPDVELDHMTRDNLMLNGRPFADAFNAGDGGPYPRQPAVVSSDGPGAGRYDWMHEESTETR